MQPFTPFDEDECGAFAGKGVFDHRKENYPDITEAIPGRKYKMTLYIHS